MRTVTCDKCGEPVGYEEFTVATSRFFHSAKASQEVIYDVCNKCDSELKNKIRILKLEFFNLKDEVE